MLEGIDRFLKQESAGGLLLMATAALAMIIANTPLNQYYELLLELPIEVRLGPLFIGKPLLLWINDGLMAIFFFLIGLELKRELVVGELSKPGAIALPAAGAVGGMVIPAGVYAFINWGDPIAMQGWPIPAATDIAFALGILALLGKRVPVSLKVFLVSLAIFDDMGAIVIIALLYTSNISLAALIIAGSCVIGLTILNRRGVLKIAPYLLLASIMWIAVLKSGVHATLAGIIAAMFIPLKTPDPKQTSPLIALEHDLHSIVAFFVLPVFAFANAGINLSGISAEYLLHPIPLGIAAGLFVGKQIGIFGFCWLAIKAGWAKMPVGANWVSLYGTGLLCGIGFTMSLFIGSLAFEETGDNILFDERLGIIVGSLLSGIAGYILLRIGLSRKASPVPET